MLVAARQRTFAGIIPNAHVDSINSLLIIVGMILPYMKSPDVMAIDFHCNSTHACKGLFNTYDRLLVFTKRNPYHGKMSTID